LYAYKYIIDYGYFILLYINFFNFVNIWFMISGTGGGMDLPNGLDASGRKQKVSNCV
jgi:hypothetical protein